MTSVQLFDLFKQNQPIREQLLKYSSQKDGQLYFQKYKIVKYLGKGSFARVYKAVHSDTSKVVALKVIDLQELEGKFPSPEMAQKIKKYMKTQERNMQKCKSAYIVKLFESFSNEKVKILVLQYCNGSTLQHYIKKRGGLEQKNAIVILKEIIFGLAEMHRNGIIHRDMKPANILLHNGVFKIADLGFSKELPQEEESIHTVLGTLSTMAPEVVKNQPYNFKADIWSLGVIFFMMLCYDLDYSLQQNYRRVQTFLELKQKNKLHKFNEAHISLQAIDFLKNTLEVDKIKRMSWQQTLTHNIFYKKDEQLPQFFILQNNEDFQQLRRIKQRQTIIGMQSIDNQSLLKSLQSVKEGQSFRFNPQQREDYQILNHEYFQCRKAQYLFYHLITPIQDKYMLDKKEKSHVQMLLLLVVRCKTDISRAGQRIKNHYPQEIVELFFRQVRLLSEKVKLKFDHVSDLLQQIENKVGSMIKERMIKLINKNSFNDREKFLTGVQGLDFTREEQIDFTYSKYIVELINQLKGNKKDELAIRKIMKIYRVIATISQKQLSGMGMNNYIESKMKSLIQ